MTAETVGNALIIISAAAIWTFVISYQFLAPWWRSSLGRLVMVSKFEFALVLTLMSARVIFGATLETTWYEVLRLIVFAGVPVVFVLQVVALYRFQLGEYRRRLNENHQRGKDPGSNDRISA